MAEGNGNREAGRFQADIENLGDRLDRIEAKLDKIFEEWKPDVESRLTSLNVKMTLWHGAQVIFTTIAGVVAAVLGRQP